MSTGARGGRGWLSLLMLLALGACQRESPAPAKTLIFPRLASGQDQLDTLRLRGPGNTVLVTLRRQRGSWSVVELGDWPADAGRISRYLFVLSQANLVERKTDNPALYPRIGVQSLSAAPGAGTELELSGPGQSSRLLIGNEHSRLDSNYVRVDGQAQAWLTDLPVSFDRDPQSWLDRRLLDLPLDRIDSVQVTGSDGDNFSLSHRDDRFRLDGAPSAAMHDSHLGDALAGVLDQLQFEHLSNDADAGVALREVSFATVDGSLVSLQVRRRHDQLWVRVLASLDPKRAATWLRQSGSTPAKTSNARRQVEQWNARFGNRLFQLPENVTKTLMLSHQDILAGMRGP